MGQPTELGKGHHASLPAASSGWSPGGCVACMGPMAVKRVPIRYNPQGCTVFPQDLIADLKYELTGKFERLIVGLMRPLAYCDAKEIKDAISVRSVYTCMCACVLGTGTWVSPELTWQMCPAKSRFQCHRQTDVDRGQCKQTLCQPHSSRM